MTIDAVIFDIGNVLIEWQPERFYDRVIGAPARRMLFETLDLHGMNDRIDRGADFRETIDAAAEAHPDHADAIHMWHDNWLEMASPDIPGSVALLHALKTRGVPVFALSNFGIGTFALARTQYPFLDAFDRRYISGHMGVIKPESEIYAMVERDCGIAPDRLLFTDDRPKNIAAADARGWQTHLFDGAQGWAARLAGAGLLNCTKAEAS